MKANSAADGSLTTFTTADANGLTSRISSHRSDAAFPGQPSFSFGPLDVHAGSLVRKGILRQKFDITDRLAASAGMFYDFKSSRVGPTASLIYRLDDKQKSKSRLELSDSKVLLRKGWEVQIKQATVGVSAECSLSFKSEDGKALTGQPIRPDLHLSLDHVKPFKYEMIGIGLVLLLNLPLKLSNKEFEVPLPWGLGHLKGFGRASLKRTGYMQYKLGAGEASGILDL